MTKQQLEKLLGITLEEGKDTYTDDEAFELINKKHTELTSDLTKHKNLLSTRNSEIAEYKRKEQEKLSDDEKLKLHYEELEKENAGYKRTIAKSNKVNEYLGIGYPKELAEKIAEAELDGKSTVELHKQFLTSREESIKAELLKGNNKPETKTDTKTYDVDWFKKASLTELSELHEKNPTLYAELDSKSKE